MKKLKILLKKIGIFKYYMKVKNLFLPASVSSIAETVAMDDQIAFYRSFINKGDVYFDVGANVGNRIKVMQHITDQIVAVEPQPDCVKELKRQFGDTIRIEPVGLAAKEGVAEMYIANESTISSFSKEFVDSVKNTRFKHNNWNKTRTMEMTTLDNLIKKHGEPAFCKIDVEGYEYQVLQGLSKSLKYISFEYCVPEMNTSLINCINYLHSTDSSLLYNYSVGESMKLAGQEWLSHRNFIRLIAEQSFINSQFGDIYVKRPATP